MVALALKDVFADIAPPAPQQMSSVPADWMTDDEIKSEIARLLRKYKEHIAIWRVHVMKLETQMSDAVRLISETQAEVVAKEQIAEGIRLEEKHIERALAEAQYYINSLIQNEKAAVDSIRASRPNLYKFARRKLEEYEAVLGDAIESLIELNYFIRSIAAEYDPETRIIEDNLSVNDLRGLLSANSP